MCGIAAAVEAGRPDLAEEAVRRMLAAMRHRGPDDAGVTRTNDLALGMRRLSIIDLAGGSQPMTNEDHTIAVVFNGEIYNFAELMRELKARGHVFRSRSDTESIVHAYEEWGPDCVHRFRGMFAFAVHDRRGDGTLFLARDRFGIKPLYYARMGDVMLVASEVRALLATRLLPRRVSRTAVESYLLFGSVGDPSTIVEGVESLPPGHRMLVDLAAPTRASVPDRYWNPLSEADREASSMDVRSAAAGLRNVLEEAVGLHLAAEVPLGVFLSGGIDSTLLAALARPRTDVLHTLTVTFDHEEFSEGEIARATARRLGAEHRELVLSGDEILHRLDEAVGSLDQPSADGINTYFVSWAARAAGLKVALSGLGGDELFGGYSTFTWTRRLQRIGATARRVPAAIRKSLAPALQMVGSRRAGSDAASKLLALWTDPDGLPHPYFFSRLLFTPTQVHALLRRSAHPAMTRPWLGWLADASRESLDLDAFTAVSYLEARSYLLNTLLRDTDAVSMANSLEVRVPFLDHRLAWFVLGLPDDLKRRRGRPKALLQSAAYDLLPPEVARRPKRTFTLPWERWMRTALRHKVSEGLREVPPSLREILEPGEVSSVWESFRAQRTGWSRPWSLYVLNAWVRRNVDLVP